MTTQEFIEQIAFYVKKYAPLYNIKVYSPIIAQAILESAKGTSELAVNAHNYFGLKYKVGRCPTASGVYYKMGSEQNADGSYTQSSMQWFKFDSIEDCVNGYFDFINNQRYQNLKGVTNPQEYLDNIKADGYATSLNYVSNLMHVIDTYDLTVYDDKAGDAKMIINVHAGHNPDGAVACGAIGYIKESTQNRKVKNEVVRLLKAQGHTVYDCTVDNGLDSKDVLQKIVAKCNAHAVDLDVSIHFNAGSKDADDATTGTEVLVYSENSKSKTYAERTCNAISELGFKNRGVKCRPDLYVLKNTKAPAMLVECCFVDDKNDVALYDYKAMASAIVYGITGQRQQEATNTLYRVQVGAYRQKANAEAMLQRLKESGFEGVIVEVNK